MALVRGVVDGSGAAASVCVRSVGVNLRSGSTPPDALHPTDLHQHVASSYLDSSRMAMPYFGLNVMIG